MELTDKTLEAFAQRHGIKGRRILSILGRNQQFINAMNSPTGQEFLKRLVARVEHNRIIFDKMDIDSSDKKFAEARARYDEAFEVLTEFLDIVDGQEKLLKDLVEDMAK